MKNYYLLFSSLLLLVACDQGQEDTVVGSNNIQSSSTILKAKGNSSLITTVEQLVTTYESNPLKNNTDLLSKKITVLDSISIQNQLFLSLKPVNYNVTTLDNATKFITDEKYSQEYDSLAVSTGLKNYFGYVTDVTSDLDAISQSIESNNILTVNEKELLYFIIDSLQTSVSGNGETLGDASWRKKMIVAATQGYTNSSANAVFNVSLLMITF